MLYSEFCVVTILTLFYCAVGAFIGTWTMRVDQHTVGGTTTPVVGSLGATCTNGHQFVPTARTPSSAATGSFRNGSVMLDSTESPQGYTSFEVTPTSLPGLEDLTGLDDGIPLNGSLACPQGYNAIGYTAAAHAYGVNYLDVSLSCPPCT